MPIQHALLALLAGGESYGYELRAEFERAVGPQWGELNVGHLYQVLERLERDGLASRRSVPQLRRPDRGVYRLTEKGRVELEDWLARPFRRQRGYRDDFFLKLFAAARLGREQLDAVLRTQRVAYLTELSSLAKLRETHSDEPLVELLVDAAIRHTEANLATLERAATRTDALTSAVASTRADQDAGRTEAEAAG